MNKKTGKEKASKPPVPRTCQTCEFDSKDMCIIHGEDYKPREEFHTCNDWSVTLSAFTKQDKRSRR